MLEAVLSVRSGEHVFSGGRSLIAALANRRMGSDSRATRSPSLTKLLQFIATATSVVNLFGEILEIYFRHADERQRDRLSLIVLADFCCAARCKAVEKEAATSLVKRVKRSTMRQDKSSLRKDELRDSGVAKTVVCCVCHA